MNVDRPKGLVLQDITIRNRGESSENDEKNQTLESEKIESMQKTDLFAGLLQDNAQSGNVDNFEMIPISLLDDFYDHPFKPYTEEDMNELVESVKALGVIQPLTVRAKENGRFEILVGHNRRTAAKRAGQRTVPCKKVTADDDAAKLIVTDSNLKQRQKLSYGEKARAFKMQLEALKKQGKRRDLLDAIDQENNFGQILPEVKNARETVAEINNTSARQISNYIRLLFLTDELLEKVDSERITFTSGVELSYLPEEMQERINSLLETFDKLTVTIQGAETLRSLTEDDLSNEDFLNILTGKPIGEKPKQKATVPFKMAFKAAEKKFKKVDQYTVQNIDQEVLEKVVIDAVEEYLLKLRS